MAVPVNIVVTSGGAPVAGATVAVFDPDLNLLFITQATTDANGLAAFLLPGLADPGKRFELRFFKVGFLFQNPVAIDVVEPDILPNTFDVPAVAVDDFGVPANPRLCRVVGRLLNYSGRPVPDAVVRVMNDQNLIVRTPKIVDGALISADEMETRTDKSGFFILDLLRGAELRLSFSGEVDELWMFKVPDLPRANASDLIHPQPVSMSWGMVGTLLAVGAGQTVDLPISVLFSDTITRTENLASWIEFTNSDPSILDAVFSGHTLRLVGKAPGAAVITPSVRTDLLPRRVPDYGLGSTMPLQVTVTP